MRILINDKNEFDLVLNKLSEIGILGNIVIGTYIPDNVSPEDIEYFNDGSKYSFNSISVSLENYINVRKYSSCFKIKNILVSISTKYDVKMGDVSKEVFKFNELDNFIKEVKNLI